MCASPVRDIEEALIQLHYPLADYYICNKPDRDAEFNTFDAPIYELRKSALSAHLKICLSGAKPKTVRIKDKASVFLRAVR
jgi:hypothetical protein